MTERLSQIEERLKSVTQLSSVVAAIRGIAAARVREGEKQLEGIRAYADGVGEAIGEALALLAGSEPARQELPESPRRLVIVLCSEQGFVGAFNSRILDQVERLHPGQAAELFVIGDHGLMVAGERGLEVGWSAPMAMHVEEATSLANRLAEVLYDRVRAGVASVTLVHAAPAQAQEQEVVARQLIPFDLARFPRAERPQVPLITLPPEQLLSQLVEEYVFAELCEAAVLSFAAENQARMRSMISAHDNVTERKAELTAKARLRRQEEITSEVVELAAGVAASR